MAYSNAPSRCCSRALMFTAALVVVAKAEMTPGFFARNGDAVATAAMAPTAVQNRADAAPGWVKKPEFFCQYQIQIHQVPSPPAPPAGFL